MFCLAVANTLPNCNLTGYRVCWKILEWATASGLHVIGGKPSPVVIPQGCVALVSGFWARALSVARPDGGKYTLDVEPVAGLEVVALDLWFYLSHTFPIDAVVTEKHRL